MTTKLNFYQLEQVSVSKKTIKPKQKTQINMSEQSEFQKGKQTQSIRKLDQQQKQSKCQPSYQCITSKLYYLCNSIITYLQYDQVLSLAQIQVLKQSNHIIKRKYLQNYKQTYEERQKKFTYTYEDVYKIRLQEESQRQTSLFQKVKRFICCEQTKQYDDMDQLLTKQTENSFYTKNIKRTNIKNYQTFNNLQDNDAFGQKLFKRDYSGSNKDYKPNIFAADLNDSLYFEIDQKDQLNRQKQLKKNQKKLRTIQPTINSNHKDILVNKANGNKRSKSKVQNFEQTDKVEVKHNNKNIQSTTQQDQLIQSDSLSFDHNNNRNTQMDINNQKANKKTFNKINNSGSFNPEKINQLHFQILQNKKPSCQFHSKKNDQTNSKDITIQFQENLQNKNISQKTKIKEVKPKNKNKLINQHNQQQNDELIYQGRQEIQIQNNTSSQIKNDIITSNNQTSHHQLESANNKNTSSLQTGQVQSPVVKKLKFKNSFSFKPLQFSSTQKVNQDQYIQQPNFIINNKDLDHQNTDEIERPQNINLMDNFNNKNKRSKPKGNFFNEKQNQQEFNMTQDDFQYKNQNHQQPMVSPFKKTSLLNSSTRPLMNKLDISGISQQFDQGTLAKRKKSRAKKMVNLRSDLQNTDVIMFMPDLPQLEQQDIYQPNNNSNNNNDNDINTNTKQRSIIQPQHQVQSSIKKRKKIKNLKYQERNDNNEVMIIQSNQNDYFDHQDTGYKNDKIQYNKQQTKEIKTQGQIKKKKRKNKANQNLHNDKQVFQFNNQDFIYQ